MTRKNWAFDIAVAGVVLLLGQLEAWWGINATHRQGPAAAEALQYGLTALALLLRRRRPMVCLVAIVLVGTVAAVIFGSPEGIGVMLPPMIAGYTVAVRFPLRRSWLALPLCLLAWAGWMYFDPMNHGWPDRLMAAIWLTPFLISWLVGALLRMTRLYADQRRATRDQQASRAVAEERNRIARELHDVIGHSVTVMTVQAAAVRRRLTADQVAERDALQTVESVGREALAEMRRMVGILRAGDRSDGLEPSPGLDQLERLADQFRRSGLPVELAVTGAVRPLTPGVDLTAYRLVQEGLTNALHHANGPHCAEVAITYTDRELTLSVRDDGRSPPIETATPGTGNGLIGMRERVAVYGGRLIAGTRAEGGFELLATLPLEPA